MSGSSLFHNGERVDLVDMKHVAATYPKHIQASLIRWFLGLGVMQGFRIKVLPQSGNTLGHIEVFNGIGSIANSVLNSETGTLSQRVVLPAPNTEYWIEVELQEVESMPDSRAFWDSTFDNVDPIPDGAEVAIARTFTRLVSSWRVVQPIRSNAAKARTDGAYTPVLFSDSHSLLLPLAVIRTNASGQVSSGNPDLDANGNDLAFTSNAEGTQTWIKAVGYSEPEHTDGGGFAKVQGRNTTDQRLRLFEPLLPPFSSPISEMIGDTTSDYWIRDFKSAFDYLAHAIGQIKHGAGESTTETGKADFGQFYDLNISAIDSELQWVDVNAIFANQLKSAGLPTTTTVDPQQLVGCTLQFTTGSWAGFYAQVRGNERTDGGGITRIYLGNASHVPAWRPLPATAFSGRVVQHRQKNWLAKPTPSSNFRGLNALDDEVVKGRVDLHSGRSFPYLTNRINAGKRSRLVLSPVDGRSTTTGELVNQLPADEAASIALQQNAISDVIANKRGGQILLRAGSYNFDSLLPSSSVFSLANAKSVELRGEGRDSTILSFGASDSNPEHVLFNVTGQDVTIRDMTLIGVGTLLKINASRVRLFNVRIQSTFYDLATPSIHLNSSTHLTIERCELLLSGSGIKATSLEYLTIRDNYIEGLNSSVQQDTLLDVTGILRRACIEKNFFFGYPASAVVRCAQMYDSTFSDNTLFAFVPDTSTGAVLQVVNQNSSARNVIVNNRFESPAGVGGYTRMTLKMIGAKHCVIKGNYFELSRNAIILNEASHLGTTEGCIVEGNVINGPLGGEYGIYAERSFNSCIKGNSVVGYDFGIYAAYSSRSTFADNLSTKAVSFGLQFSDGGIAASGCQDCNILGNLVEGGPTVGFDLRECLRTHVSGNSVKGITATAYVMGGSISVMGGHLHELLTLGGGPVAGFTDDLNAGDKIYVSPYNTYLP